MRRPGFRVWMVMVAVAVVGIVLGAEMMRKRAERFRARADYHSLMLIRVCGFARDEEQRERFHRERSPLIEHHKRVRPVKAILLSSANCRSETPSTRRGGSKSCCPIRRHGPSVSARQRAS